MIPVLCRSPLGFDMFIKTHNLDRKTYVYANGRFDDYRGREIGSPMILLDGYQHNPNYSTEFIVNMGRRYDATFLSERQIWRL